jgi:Leucine-rich repeat (LRR) protein
LKRLDLDNNELTNLEGIDKLTNLKRLYLDDNKLTSLKGIENLTNLESLYLDNNNLSGSEKARLKKIFGNKVNLIV